jgi:hypothetical protein
MEFQGVLDRSIQRIKRNRLIALADDIQIIRPADTSIERPARPMMEARSGVPAVAMAMNVSDAKSSAPGSARALKFL